MIDTLLLNSRKTGKIIQMDYDFITSLEGNCTYCLSDAHVQMILAHLDLFGWRTRWYSSTNTIDMQTILDLQGSLASALMNPCCNDTPPSLFRFTITGVLQISIDNGTTWQDAPQFDPRNNSPQFPPVDSPDGDDKKCVAAEGMKTLIKEQVGDNLTDGMSRYTLSQLISDWIRTYIDTSNPFTALITIAVNQIFALIIAVLRPALTDAVYETLKCIFYCNMGDDASFNDSQWTQVRSDITDQIGGIAGIFFEHLVFLLGVVGLTNLARSEAVTTATCDCSCGNCDLDNWSITVFSGNPVGVELSRGVNYIEIQTAVTPGFGGGQFAILQTNADNVCCVYDHAESTDSYILKGLYCEEPRWPSTAVHTIAENDLVNCIYINTTSTSDTAIVKVFLRAP